VDFIGKLTQEGSANIDYTTCPHRCLATTGN